MKIFKEKRNKKNSIKDKTPGLTKIDGEYIFTKEGIARIFELAGRLTADDIAGYFGIFKNTFYKILERQSEAMEAFFKGKSHAVNTVSEALYRKAIGDSDIGDTTAATFYLKTFAGWKDPNIHDVTLNTAVSTPLTEEEEELRTLDIKLYDKFCRENGFDVLVDTKEKLEKLREMGEEDEDINHLS
jgi:hypothetical protein